jgi:hypothetical protein
LLSHPVAAVVPPLPLVRVALAHDLRLLGADNEQPVTVTEALLPVPVVGVALDASQLPLPVPELVFPVPFIDVAAGPVVRAGAVDAIMPPLPDVPSTTTRPFPIAVSFASTPVAFVNILRNKKMCVISTWVAYVDALQK